MFNSTPVSPYSVSADIHRSVQHVTLWHVPVDVLPRLFLWFSQVKNLECHRFHPPQEVRTVCAHVQCGLGCTSHLYQSLFDSALIMDFNNLPRNDLSVLGHV